MNYEDQVAALFANANPVPSLDLLDAVEPLDMERLALSARSSVMTDVKTEETKPEGPGRGARIALAVAMGVIAVVAIGLLVNNDNEVASPTTTVSPVSTTSLGAEALGPGSLEVGTYTATPFAPPEEATICQPSQSGCVDPVGAESMSFTFTVPKGWSGMETAGIWSASAQPPGGAAMVFNLGGWVYSDPCTNGETSADVPVGLTVDEFANALTDNPLLEVTTPVDIELAGYSGKYLDLQVPSDITACAAYRAWEFWLYAQGPSQRWHLWILDVDGVRVVVETMDYEGTTSEKQAELEAMVDSIQIQP